jgi:hypothetical protein
MSWLCSAYYYSGTFLLCNFLFVYPYCYYDITMLQRLDIIGMFTILIYFICWKNNSTSDSLDHELGWKCAWLATRSNLLAASGRDETRRIRAFAGGLLRPAFCIAGGDRSRSPDNISQLDPGDPAGSCLPAPTTGRSSPSQLLPRCN